MSLTEYRQKRDFTVTSEPTGGKAHPKAPVFVVQEHWASHLHYDFRLEAFGVLLSWAVPKGPSTVVGDKRLAVRVEDHPIDYAKFKGEIPKGEYGAGKVKIWDRGTWVPGPALKTQIEKGRIEFELKGRRLKGKWLLQRTGKGDAGSSKHAQWFLIKRHDSNTALPKKKRVADPWPETIAPQLALLSDRVPAGDRYIHEMKFDGYRTLAFIKHKSVRLQTRNGHDWTDKYHPIDKLLRSLKARSAILDGELVCVDEKGRPDFSALQTAIKNRDMSDVVYYVFDLLYLNGKDIRGEPLEERKLLLKKLITSSRVEKVLFSEHVRGQGEDLFAQAAKEGLEGIISKDRTLPYASGRSGAWQKIKTSLRQELVIGGYTDPAGLREGLGALLMGVYDQGKLRFVGKVGTGFNADILSDLMKQLQKLRAENSPFELAKPPRSLKTNWVKPKLVAEIEFKSWTEDGVLRHASFLGLRKDKLAREVVGETAAKGTGAGKTPVAPKAPGAESAFRISHPERMIYPEADVRKIDVANYYKSVAPWLLPHVSGRPLSLLRCPNHSGEDCFFQKHVDTSAVTAVDEVLIRDQKVIAIESEEGLLQLVQWGVLEPHTWQCHLEKPLSPDQVIFDLDPDEAVTWKEVVATAFRLRDLLLRLDLKSFVKTTGGKGLHIHVPVSPIYTWEQVKSFSKSVCQQLEEEYPGKYTTNILKKTRKHKIFLDYLRNGFGATAVAPFSLRARGTPTVAVPISWDELKTLRSGAAFDIHSTLQRLATQKKDPWAQYFKTSQKIEILEPNR